MNAKGKEISIWGLANALFTFGLLLITIGVGLVETDMANLKSGGSSIALGLVMIGFGLLIYFKVHPKTE